MTELIGKTVGQYRIIEQIGKGGMATIFKAYQPSIDRYVAVKVLPKEFAQDPNFVKRFVHEAKAIAALEHPHILPVHDFGTEGNINYMVMRYVDGGTLSKIMGKPLPLPQVADYVGNVAKALDYAHRRGVVHRDIKPSNILLDEHGEVLLTDFGIAKMVEGAESTQLTAAGSILGTPAYMSPEQAQNSNVDGRSDIYSLGVVLYELLTGRPPFQAETPFAIVLKHMTDPLPPPRQINPGLPEAFERVVFKAMAKSVDDRYQTAGDMAQALQTALQHSDKPAAAPPPVAPSPATTPMPAPSPMDADSKTMRDAPPSKKSGGNSMAPLLIIGAVGVLVLCLGIAGAGLLLIGLSSERQPDVASQGSGSVQLETLPDEPEANQESELPADEEIVKNEPEPQPDEVISEAEMETPPKEDALEDETELYTEEESIELEELAEDFLFADEFESDWNGWFTGEDSDEFGNYAGNIEYGVYQLYMNTDSEDGNFLWVEPEYIEFDDFYYSAEVADFETDGEFFYGIVFRSTPEGDAYMFEIDNDGFAVFATYANDEWLTLVDYTESDAINRSGLNQLAVEAIGPALTFFINDEVVATIEDNTIGSGTIGLVLDLFDADSEIYIEFENVEVIAP